MICSVTAAHFNFKNLKLNKEIDWDQSWELARSVSNTSILKKDKLTIFSISQILLMPKESVRRKLKQMIKMKILKHSTKAGVIFGEKIDIFKPYAKDEVLALSTFLKSLKQTGALQNLLDIKKNDIK